jgi:hypothetical protein
MSASESSALRRFLNQDTSRDGEPEFQIRPRAPRRSNAESRALSGFKRVMQMFCSSARPVQGSATKLARSFNANQRCAVRVSYSPNKTRGQWRAHGRYLERDSAVGDNQPFGAAETATGLEEKLAEWQAAGDRRMFKLILSPEFGHRMDLQQFTRDFMKGIEDRVGMKLEWMAVIHNNTEHPHVHIALRGVAGGQELRLHREFIRSGMREHAEHLCTLSLGYRTVEDVLEAQRKEVGFARATSLDRQIQKRTVPISPTEMQFALPPGSREFFQLLACRMATLTKMGLAQADGSGWRLRLDFLQVLKAMQQAGDRQKMLNQYGILLSDPRLPTQVTRLKDITHLEGRVIAHFHDDATGAAHMILEGTDARIHFIRHNADIEDMRHRGALRPNCFVTISRQSNIDLAVVIADLGDVEHYLVAASLKQSVKQPAQQRLVENELSGWLGRYLRILRCAADTEAGGRVVARSAARSR